MKKTFIAFAILAASAAAYASPGGEHNNTGCNGKGNPNSPCTGNGGAGGAGGQGGAGGTAVSTSRAEARAKAAAIAAQRQAQALNSTITNTVNTAPVKVKVNVVQAAPATAPETKTAATEQTVKEPAAAEKTVVVPEAVRDVRPVSSAYAPNINPTSPCALTVSGGIQAREIGLSFGGTPIADFCEKLEIARSAFNEGEADVAKEVKCGIPAYRAARKRLKKPCAEDLQAGAERAAAILEDRHVRAYIAAKDPALLP